jgi:hypothetical protein
MVKTEVKPVVKKVSNFQAPYYKRMIRCPGHYLISPKVDVYLREPVPELKDCSDGAEYKGRYIKIKKMRIVKDRFGNKMLDWKKLYELRNRGTGEVLNPIVSASWAIENVWDPKGMLCLQCPKYCREMRNVSDLTIKRLNYDRK